MVRKLYCFSLCLLFLFLTSCSKIYERSAATAYESKNYTQSINTLNKIPKKYVNYNTFVMKANAYLALGERDKAFESYKIASSLNNNIILTPLISLYFYNGDVDKSLELINKLEQSGESLTLEQYKIKYISLYRNGNKEEANDVLNNYLYSLDNFEITKLKILAFDNSSTLVSQSIIELCSNDEFEKAEELLDMSYSYNNLNSSFLSVLNSIVDNEKINLEFRAKAAYYTSLIFESINNIKQFNYYSEYYEQLSKDIDIRIPAQVI